jgi:hypothetical protein
MLLSARSPITAVYSVEVSGWDVTHVFFVEKSALEWNEESGKHLVLHHALPEGAMIFVRLLQAASEERAFPVAYEAKFEGFAPDGRHEFLLNQAQPQVDGRGDTIQ